MSLKNFELYQLAREFLRIAHQIADQLPRGYSELKDQLKRASLSILLNAAEGAGKYSPAEQKRHYTIARGSAFECYAAVDATEVLELVKSASFSRGMEVIDSIISILTKLCTK